MSVWLIVVAAVLLATPILIALTVYVSAVRMSRSEKFLTPAHPEQFPREYDIAMGHLQWAEEKGFEPVGTYTFSAVGTAFIAAWQQPAQRRFFCVYRIANKTSRDFVTLFERDAALTTGNNQDGLLLPQPPGSFTQVFVNATIEEQWSRHLEAEQFLARNAGVRTSSYFKPFAESFVEGVRRQIAYVRSLPLWPLRAPYWYFIRRKKMRNKTVEQQFEVGQAWGSPPV